jgi:hypothetical protein
VAVRVLQPALVTRRDHGILALRRIDQGREHDIDRRLDVATAQLGEALSQVRALTDQRPARRRWWRWR